MNDKILYQHRRLDTGEVFYVGIGDIKRPNSKYNRNKYWNNIVNKSNYKVEIIKTNLSKEEACDLEKILISWYGRKNLCNMTDGGEGVYSYKHTEESKLRMSKSHTGKKQKQESIDKMIINRSRKIINIKNKIIYLNINEVSTILNINKSTLRSRLSGLCNNKTDYMYLDLYETENNS